MLDGEVLGVELGFSLELALSLGQMGKSWLDELGLGLGLMAKSNTHLKSEINEAFPRQERLAVFKSLPFTKTKAKTKTMTNVLSFEG